MLFWFLRRRSRREEFDGNFDPDRVVSGGRPGEFDLAGDITPYSYAPGVGGAPPPPPPAAAAGGPGAAHLPPQMSQHGQLRAAAGLGAGAAGTVAGSSSVNRSGTQNRTEASSAPSAYSQSDPATSQYADYAAYAGYAASSQQGHGADGYQTSISSPTSPGRSSYQAPQGPAADYRHPSPGPSITMTSNTNDHSSSSGNGANAGLIPSSKEREAREGRLHVANESGQVVQHQDGGRLDVTPHEDEGPSEIPPSYDSIPRDRQ